MAKAIANKHDDNGNGRGKQVALSEDDNLPSFIGSNVPAGLEPGTDAGTSRAAEDNLVPLVYVLQQLSPQVEERDPKYVPGARPGMIWLRNCIEGPELVDGNVGMLWQQCWFGRTWIEWVPREEGGDMVARYKDIDDAPDCPGARKPKPGEYNWTNPETGYEIALNKLHVGHVIRGNILIPFTIIFKGAGIAESKAWMGASPSRRPDGSKCNAWDWCWQIKTRFKSNAKGKWYDIHAAKRLGFISDMTMLDAGKMLFEQLNAGEKRAADDDEASANETVSTMSTTTGATAERPF